MPEFKQNEFLVNLLSLQQDGRHAISAPSNWVNKPLLEVETEVDNIIDELENSILIGPSSNELARWHFFIGSPGNGKSAAMGKLCRQLRANSGCQISDEKGVSIDDLDSSVIPYAMNVFEDGNKFISAQIIQDASVVRNPYSRSVDPASELLKTLEEAWQRGISLIVCTNRGVLEKAHRDNHTNHAVNSKPWFKVLAGVVTMKTSPYQQMAKSRAFDGRKNVFKELRVSCSHLDNRSLLLEQDTFDRLVQKATSGARWTACESCAANNMCPFWGNRNWLIDEESRTKMLTLFRRAEVLSGQIVVFREALAIVSLILSGCPKDYEQLHPCDWVKEAIGSDDIFSLAARRIYMCLFASFAPHGLEDVQALRDKQIDALRSASGFLDEADESSKRALSHVIEKRSPSTDVGVTRFLGSSGVLASLDPCREALSGEFYQRWDADFRAAVEAGGEAVTKLETECIGVWKVIEECLESASDHSVSEAHWALQRWASNFLLHFGALLEGRSAWADELDEFAKLLGLVAVPAEDRSIEDKRKLRQLDGRVEELLSAVAAEGAGSTVLLSDAVTLSGQWVRENLKPSTIASDESGSVSLSVGFDGGEKAVFAAPIYLWLTRRADGKLDHRCFPQELMSGASDARVRAASKGKYAFQDNDVTLEITAGNRGVFRLDRFDGEVDVTND